VAFLSHLNLAFNLSDDLFSFSLEDSLYVAFGVFNETPDVVSEVSYLVFDHLLEIPEQSPEPMVRDFLNEEGKNPTEEEGMDPPEEIWADPKREAVENKVKQPP